LQEIEEEDFSSSVQNHLKAGEKSLPQWSVLVANDDLF
jgi:hypothetical protein